MTRQTRAAYDDRRQPPRRDGVRSDGRLVTPLRLILLVALVGSFAYVGYAILMVRDTTAIPMLALGAAILGVVFLALAIAGGRGTFVAGREGRDRDAFLLAIGGGVAAVIAFGSFAGAVILTLLGTALA